jgi:hypothetical protein
MKTFIYLLISLSISFLSSCQVIILGLVGMHKPSIETRTSIETFLSKKGQSITDVYAIDTTLEEKLRSLPFKPGWPAGFRPIQIRAYDKAGKPIMHWASCEGFLNNLKTFDTVPPRNQVNLDSTLNLQMDLDRYFTLDGKPAQIKAEAGYDYYFIVYFAKYFYRMSKTSFAEVEKYQKSHPELRIKVYKINVDVLDWWNAELITDFKIHH